MAEAVTPMLGDVELTSVQSIETGEQRALVAHHVPGMAGSAFQDMGRLSARVAISGLVFGEEAKAGVEDLRGKFQGGEPIPFSADITTATDIVDVVIETLFLREVAGRPNSFRYDIVVHESPPPPPPLDPFGAVDLGILDDALGLFDQALALADLVAGLGDIPDFGDPTVPLDGILDELGAVTRPLAESLGALGALFGSGES